MIESALEICDATTGRFIRRFVVYFVSLAAFGAGCTSPGTRLVESPLSVDEQQRAVLAIVPEGTSRDAAERRLKAAGIEFSQGGNGSIYYLTLWNRADGERWHIKVALLFDSAGKLYQTRSADSSIAVSADDPAVGLPKNSAGNHRTVDSPQKPASPASVSDATSDDLERRPFSGQAGSVPANR